MTDDVYMVRGYYSGRIIHRSDCRHAQGHPAGPGPTRWQWADAQGYDRIDWDHLRISLGVRPCKQCRPDLMSREADAATYLDHRKRTKKNG
jgi:hypothetical protein